MKDPEAGVHFGHQTMEFKMKEFIFGERNGIYILAGKTLLFRD